MKERVSVLGVKVSQSVCVCVCPPADYKRLLAQSELPAAVKADALRDDFNLDGLPQVISEVQ